LTGTSASGQGHELVISGQTAGKVFEEVEAGPFLAHYDHKWVAEGSQLLEAKTIPGFLGKQKKSLLAEAEL